MTKKEISSSDFVKLFDEANEVNDYTISELVSNAKERYINFEEYSEGGLKKIYLCDDIKSGRRIVMAKLKVNDNPGKIENFLKEARINAAMQHPNIVPVYDIGIDENNPWFTMKIIEGHTLQIEIENLSNGIHSQLENLNNRLDVFNKICDAVSYAHSKGVIHSDLNPRNICISEFGNVVVYDWGLADIIPMECDEKLLELCTLTSLDISDEPCSGIFEGTPGHASPEHTGLLKQKKGKSSDIFSLGTILYSLLTFEAPFSGEDIEEIIKKTVNCDFEKPSQLKPNLNIPSSVEAVCIKAMAKDPQDRYQSVEELQIDILAYRNGFTTEAENASVIKAIKLFFVRNRVKSLFSIALLTAATVLFALYLNNITLARQNAEQLAEKNRIQKEYFEKINKESAPLFFQSAKNAYDSFHLDDALKFSKTAVQVDPSLKEAWKIKGIVHLALNEFKDAESSLKMTGKNDYLSRIAGEYALKYGNSKLSIDQYINLILEIKEKGSSYIAFRLMNYKMYENISIDDRIIFCKAMLKMLNPFTRDISFKYDILTKTLDLSGNKKLINVICLQNFPAESINLSHTKVSNFISVRDSPLKKLNVSNTPILQLGNIRHKGLRELNISNTGLSNLFLLKDLPLEVLNISHTPIRSLQQVSAFKTLKKLYLDKDQGSDQKQLMHIPKTVEVIIVD